MSEGLGLLDVWWVQRSAFRIFVEPVQPLRKHTYPTDPFTTLQLDNPSDDVSEQLSISHFPGLEASKCLEDRSGYSSH